MAEPSSIPPVSTFVVRFWREWSSTGPRWRGHVEHVQSGESTSCQDLKGIIDFIQHSGVMAGNLGQRSEMDA